MRNLLARFQQNLSELECKVENGLALAVSGGSDSMALLVLASQWASEAGVALSVLTVDHHLRAVSREEAEYVGKVCAQLGLPHQILDWIPQDGNSNSNIQARARKARYDLMTNWCHEHGIKTLLTAHHLDDQVENFFIRLSRASGLSGLLDHSIGLYDKVQILRPLFNIPKLELRTYLNEQKVRWYEDASNEDLKYQRSSIRKWLASMPSELEPELFKARVLQSQQHLRSAANYIQRALDRELEEGVVIHENGAEYMISQDELIAHMTLSHLLMLVSGQDEPARSEAVMRLREQMLGSGKKATLHGCTVEMRGNGIVAINREVGRKRA